MCRGTPGNSGERERERDRERHRETGRQTDRGMRQRETDTTDIFRK